MHNYVAESGVLVCLEDCDHIIHVDADFLHGWRCESVVDERFDLRELRGDLSSGDDLGPVEIRDSDGHVVGEELGPTVRVRIA